MESKASAKHIRISAQKMRLVTELIKNLSIDHALAVLWGLKNRKKAAEIVEKTLKSAVANFSVREPNIDTDQLKIKEIIVSSGPFIKRIRPRAQGRAMRILKKTAHLSVTITN
jgi:large subunit ribosomal protein L22